MSEQYEEYIRTGLMPQEPNWEYFKSMGHKDLDYYTDEYNIMRLEDEWVMKRLNGNNMDQVFGMVEIGRTDEYEFINDILGDDVVWSVQKRNNDNSKPKDKIHMVNVYGTSCKQVKNRLKGLEYNIIDQYHYMINAGECGVINLALMASNNVSISKHYHHHNMRYNSYTIVYKGTEYITKRQLFYRNNKKHCYLEIGVNDNKFLVFGRRSLKIPNYSYANKIEGLDKKNIYEITSDISLATFWVLVTSGYKITLTKNNKKRLKREKYRDMDEFLSNIVLNDLQYVKLEC